MDLTGSNAGLEARASDGAGIIVVDRARKIVFKNPMAERVLGSNSSLLECHHTLAGRVPSVDVRLRAAVLNPGRDPSASAAPHLMRLPRALRMPLLALMVPLEASAAEDLGALLLFWDPQTAPALPAAVLRQHFGLTTAEASIALATYEGQTPATIAMSRQRSITTVRTLLSRVFSKCGVKRQAELVRLLAGIANACCFADGIRTGMEIQRSMQDRIEPHASLLPVHEALMRQLLPARDLKAVVHLKELAPGEGTAPHYHAHGHEVLCVLRGRLTTVFGSDEYRVTPPGQSRYVGENVLHHGRNTDARTTVQVLSINVTRRGRSSRVDMPAAFA
jgi:DNA-binding CsgD family transcriptional regulator/mannose-6-phosphate isomerase-like protein (cupin superfamily)